MEVALLFLKGLPWKKIVPAVAVVAVIGLVWWQVASHFSYVSGLEEENKTLQKEALEDEVRLESQRAIIKKSNDEAAEKELELKHFKLAYVRGREETPVEIIKWRERIVTVPQEIVGPTCEDALIQAHQVVLDTAGWPGGVP